MRTDILERVEARANRRFDKACGKSFVPDKAKCSKDPITRQTNPESTGDTLAKVEALQKTQGFGKLPESLRAIAIGATMVGLSVAAYQEARTRYRAGFEKSAQMAERIAKHVPVSDIPNAKKAITFTTGGFYGYEGEAAARKGEDYFAYKMKTDVLGSKDNPGGDHHIVSHRNTKFNTTPSPVGGPLSHVRDTFEHYATMLRTTLGKGRNPEAIKLAAEVMAYNQKYPDKEINLVGHSAGGMISHEAAEILNKRNIKVKIVNLGTGHFGLTEKVGESHTIAFHEDMYLKTIPGTARDAVMVGDPSAPLDPDKHRIRAYMNEESSRAKMRELLKPRSQRTDVSIQERIRNDAPNNCERGERCGETCIDPKEECNIKDVSPEIGAAISDLSDAVLGAIPGYGQIIAAKKLLVTGKAALRATKNPNTPLSKKVVMGAIILAGISYLGYQKYRDHRRNAVAESATIAKTSAKGMPVRDTQKDQITFTLDGTGKGGKQAIKGAMGESKAFDNHEIIDFSESLDDPMELPDDMSDRDKKIAREAENAKNNFGALTSGRSNHAVDLAAQVLAYRAKYPNKRINIVAHGSGVQVAIETADIVKKADSNGAQKLKVVNLQAPDYGIYDSVPGTTTVASDRNPTTLLPMKNKTTFGVDDPGDGSGFFKNRRSLAYIKGYLASDVTDVRRHVEEEKSEPAPITRKPLSQNVPRQTFTQTPSKTTENPFDTQGDKTKLYNLENNVRSTEGVIKILKAKREEHYANLEDPALSTETKLEIEEAALHITRSLNSQNDLLRSHQEKLEAHRKLVPKQLSAAKADSIKFRKRADSIRLANASFAALKGAIVGAGIATFNRKPKSKVMSGGR